MAINFCNENLGTRVQTDKVCADDYEVVNLLRADTQQRRKGFMAEYFIKPPINIVLSFPVAIEIYCIRLGLVRGPVRLTAVEVWTSHSSSGDDYIMSGRKFDLRSNEVVFENRQYHPRGPFADLHMPQFRSDYSEIATVKPMLLRSVTRLKIRLLRAEASSAVGLGSCDVWGQPVLRLCNLSVSQELIRASMFTEGLSDLESSKVWNPVTNPMELGGCTSDVQPHGQLPSPEMSSGGNTDIPGDFQDALTFELMVQPVVLPSGQVIDQSTLDKHIQAEERWGRQATDPFTGVLLCGQNTPKFLPELKARIDQYVIKNVDKLGNCPRTVGSGAGMRSRVSVTALEVAVSSLSKCKRTTGEETSYKRKNEANELNSALKIVKCDSQPSTGNSAGTSHEDRVASSLELSLEATLKTIRSTMVKPQVEEPPQCQCGNKQPEYKLPCEHYMCRTCLVKRVAKGKGVCFCKAEFSSSQVVRTHTAAFTC